MYGDKFVARIQSVTEETEMIGLGVDVYRHPDLATQKAADAFLQRAIGAETWGMKQKALEGVYEVIYNNHSVANSTMVAVVNKLATDPVHEVRSQATAILTLIGRRACGPHKALTGPSLPLRP